MPFIDTSTFETSMDLPLPSSNSSYRAMYVPLSQMYLKKVPSGPSLLKDSDSVHIAPDGALRPMLMSIAMPSTGCFGPCSAKLWVAIAPV